MILAKWTCPECGAENEDDYALTTFPMCGECSETFYWHQVITKDQMAELAHKWLTDEEDN